ncbi:MAG: NUDIX hydrolase [Candidatus Subteraquimicrobiales bacterium]|nr:NUDIX hydrolase [Candidatus Subteraquimicrobiales bacterium]
METRRALSSGGVIFRQLNNEIEIALIRRDKDIWCLPKGTVEKEEELEKTALREVEEETGLQGEIIDKIGAIDYWFFWKADNVRYHKVVHFYLLEYKGGNTESHDYEVEEVRWFPIEETISIMAYKNEKEIVKKAKEMLEGKEYADYSG